MMALLLLLLMMMMMVVAVVQPRGLRCIALPAMSPTLRRRRCT
jgi:hypothetical protein